MHLILEDLLAVRDGEASAEAARHAASCPTCAAELARLRMVQRELKALSDQRPPHDLWPRVHAAIASRHRLHRLAVAGWVAAGLAAAFTLVIGVRGGLQAWHEAKLAHETRQLVAESQRLEQRLRSPDATGRVMSGSTAGTILQIEDRIALIDAQLARARDERYPSQDVVNLWQERVQLLDALLSVHTTRVAYVGL
jgi:anti-sigma factor RsiW